MMEDGLILGWHYCSTKEDEQIPPFHIEVFLLNLNSGLDPLWSTIRLKRGQPSFHIVQRYFLDHTLIVIFNVGISFQNNVYVITITLYLLFPENNMVY